MMTSKQRTRRRAKVLRKMTEYVWISLHHLRGNLGRAGKTSEVVRVLMEFDLPRGWGGSSPHYLYRFRHFLLHTHVMGGAHKGS